MILAGTVMTGCTSSNEKTTNNDAKVAEGIEVVPAIDKNNMDLRINPAEDFFR